MQGGIGSPDPSPRQPRTASLSSPSPRCASVSVSASTASPRSQERIWLRAARHTIRAPAAPPLAAGAHPRNRRRYRHRAPQTHEHPLRQRPGREVAAAVVRFYLDEGPAPCCPLLGISAAHALLSKQTGATHPRELTLLHAHSGLAEALFPLPSRSKPSCSLVDLRELALEHPEARRRFAQSVVLALRCVGIRCDPRVQTVHPAGRRMVGPGALREGALLQAAGPMHMFQRLIERVLHSMPAFGLADLQLPLLRMLVEEVVVTQRLASCRTQCRLPSGGAGPWLAVLPDSSAACRALLARLASSGPLPRTRSVQGASLGPRSPSPPGPDRRSPGSPHPGAAVNGGPKGVACGGRGGGEAPPLRLERRGGSFELTLLCPPEAAVVSVTPLTLRVQWRPPPAPNDSVLEDGGDARSPTRDAHTEIIYSDRVFRPEAAGCAGRLLRLPLPVNVAKAEKALFGQYCTRCTFPIIAPDGLDVAREL
eukprot:TRINITY_DN4440_c3_g3_i3.p1 TRINITY_DN4440_c3_g3~~TRINITY_DN4440_c3_g3_i3.p1  ORF type:complete len:512 (+),score=90.85 TRINITY_DN4440_c3_g3_i3:96-1538(+)